MICWWEFLRNEGDEHQENRNVEWNCGIAEAIFARFWSDDGIAVAAVDRATGGACGG